MCKTGGPRCAAHTAERLAKAQTALEKIMKTGAPTEIDDAASQAYEAMVNYATTPGGTEQLQQKLKTSSPGEAMLIIQAIRDGKAKAEKEQKARDLKAAEDVRRKQLAENRKTRPTRESRIGALPSGSFVPYEDVTTPSVILEIDAFATKHWKPGDPSGLHGTMSETEVRARPYIPGEKSYNCRVPLQLEPGDTAYVVAVTYTGGDTYGRRSQSTDIIGAAKTQEEAKALLAATMNYDPLDEETLFEHDGKHYFRGFRGYFDSVDYAEVNPIIVEEPEY